MTTLEPPAVIIRSGDTIVLATLLDTLVMSSRQISLPSPKIGSRRWQRWTKNGSLLIHAISGTLNNTSGSDGRCGLT